MKNILIVEDDLNIVNILEINLKNDGFNIDIAYDGNQGYDKFINNKYDVIITDLNMPHLDGNQMIKKIKEKDNNQKVIVLTALTDEVEELNSLNLGADDYVKKPFSYNILRARINKFLEHINIIEIEDVVIDLETYIVKKNNEVINITKKELDLLEYFYRNKNIILTREMIINSVWRENFATEERIVDANIKNIRKKLGLNNIKTIKGMGYRFEI
mgnify:CR=1 FL=1